MHLKHKTGGSELWNWHVLPAKLGCIKHLDSAPLAQFSILHVYLSHEVLFLAIKGGKSMYQCVVMKLFFF